MIEGRFTKLDGRLSLVELIGRFWREGSVRRMMFVDHGFEAQSVTIRSITRWTTKPFGAVDLIVTERLAGRLRCTSTWRM